MLNDIYNKRIIELAGNIPRLGRLAAPDATSRWTGLWSPTSPMT
jgi:hypothetical protein